MDGSTMTYQGLDYASPSNSTSSNLATAKQNGISFIIRYHKPLVNGSFHSYQVTQSEAQTIFNAGLELITVYESSSSQVTSPSYYTYDNGYNDGLEAVSRADSLGQPTSSTIYFAVDTDMSNYLTNVDNYFHGISDAINEFYSMNGYKWSIGIYAGKSVVEYMHNRWGIVKEWQTYAWSGGNYYTGSEIYQYANGISNYLKVFTQAVDKNGSNTTSRGGFTSLG